MLLLQLSIGLRDGSTLSLSVPSQYRIAMSDKKFHDKAIELVYNYVVNDLDYIGPFGIEDVTIVWFCKTLQNWKALVITHLPDAMYYEVTHNGDKQETYLDVYLKFENVCVRDSEG
jgi:hypothetical protein